MKKPLAIAVVGLVVAGSALSGCGGSAIACDNLTQQLKDQAADVKRTNAEEGADAGMARFDEMSNWVSEARKQCGSAAVDRAYSEAQ